MKTETALTAFCMTTVAIIVGLVMLTALQLGLADSPITSNFYVGLPEQGGTSRASIPPSFVDVEKGNPMCYQEGVKQCRRMNAGQNFIRCSDRVAVDCGYPLPQLRGCGLTAGFELKYLSKRECHYGVIDECKLRCSPEMVEDCVDRSKSRCELIGGKFQAQRLKERHTAPLE